MTPETPKKNFKQFKKSYMEASNEKIRKQKIVKI
jgi:hypothetical protein